MEQCGPGYMGDGRRGGADSEEGDIVSLDDSVGVRVDEGSNEGGTWSVGGWGYPTEIDGTRGGGISSMLTSW